MQGIPILGTVPVQVFQCGNANAVAVSDDAKVSGSVQLMAAGIIVVVKWNGL